MSDATQTFSVRSASDGRHWRHAVEAGSFEEAAALFCEIWMPDGEHALTVLVRDDAGCEQCFVLDVGTGEASPCEA
jgi:hypothetical protein